MKLTYVGRSIIYRRPDETVRFKPFLLQTERKVRNSRASSATALDENHILRKPQSHIRTDLREIRELLNGMMLQRPDRLQKGERYSDVLASSSRLLFQLTETTAVLKRAGAEFQGLSPSWQNIQVSERLQQPVVN